MDGAATTLQRRSTLRTGILPAQGRVFCTDRRDTHLAPQAPAVSANLTPFALPIPTRAANVTQMHMLLNDPIELDRLIQQNAPSLILGEGGSAADWLARPNTFALRSGEDLGLFEAGDEWPGPLTAHVLFASRGKQALTTARAMLKHAFDYGATAILAEPPVALRQSVMFARLLGFQPYGEAERPQGRVVLSRLEMHNFIRPQTMP